MTRRAEWPGGPKVQLRNDFLPTTQRDNARHWVAAAGAPLGKAAGQRQCAGPVVIGGHASDLRVTIWLGWALTGHSSRLDVEWPRGLGTCAAIW